MADAFQTQEQALSQSWKDRLKDSLDVHIIEEIEKMSAEQQAELTKNVTLYQELEKLKTMWESAGKVKGDARERVLEKYRSSVRDWQAFHEVVEGRHKLGLLRDTGLHQDPSGKWLESEEYLKEKAEIEAEEKRMREAATKHHKEVIESMPPMLYFVRSEERALRNEHRKEILTSNYSELIHLFEIALREDNEHRAAAIMQTLAEDYNDNELWNYFGYPSTSQGMMMFFYEIMMGRTVKELADGTLLVGEPHSYHDYSHFEMDEQSALSLANDMSYVNESRNHWETARLVGVKDGKFYWYTEIEHAAECLAEIRKIDVRLVMRNLNRLNYGGEYIKEGQRFKPNPSRDFRFTTLGIALAREIWSVGLYYTNEFNPNTRFFANQMREFLLTAGVNEEFLDRIRETEQRKATGEEAMASGVGEMADRAVAALKRAEEKNPLAATDAAKKAFELSKREHGDVGVESFRDEANKVAAAEEKIRKVVIETLQKPPQN